MDQVFKVAKHPSSKGVHHKVHPFFHHLHLGDYVRWNHVDDGWATHVLLFWPAWDIAFFWPILVPSLSAGALFVFLLSIKVHVLLM